MSNKIYCVSVNGPFLENDSDPTVRFGENNFLNIWKYIDKARIWLLFYHEYIWNT